jgi:nicotinamidase-related amidase
VHHAFDLDLPRTLDEVCDPRRLALVVYDMQTGIFNQAPHLRSVVPAVVETIQAARDAGVRILYCRHTSLPKELMGVSQLRTAMAWQLAGSVDEVRSLFLPNSPGWELIPEVAPLPSEAVFDKIGMSAFSGTALNLILRDCGIWAFAVVGVVLEIGIGPTVSHGTDLGYVPVVVADACGSVDDKARNRTLATIDHTMMSMTTDVAALTAALAAWR